MKKPEMTDSLKGQIQSPSGREATLKNCDGFPEEMDVKEIFKENTPPDRVATDSTKDIGKY